MEDKSLKLDLVKTNFIIFGAVLSAIKLKFPYFPPHVAIGSFLLAITALLQYLSLIPGFSLLTGNEDVDDLQKREKALENGYILLGFTAYEFLIFGFSYPYLSDGDLLMDAMPFIFAVLIYGSRIFTAEIHPQNKWSWYDSLVVVLLMMLVGTVTVGVYLRLPILP